jgi:hypothetical protein
MLDRKRARKYNVVPGEDEDVELGEGIPSAEDDEQETGITGASRPQHTLEEEVDNWDENAEDWDEDEPTSAEGEGQKTPSSAADEPPVPEPKKRTD